MEESGELELVVWAVADRTMVIPTVAAVATVATPAVKARDSFRGELMITTLVGRSVPFL